MLRSEPMSKLVLCGLNRDLPQVSHILSQQQLVHMIDYDGEADGPLNESTLSGKVLRMDTQADFQDPATYRVFDTKALSKNAVCFDGGAFDGRYIYFVPLTTSLVVQYDTTADFADTVSWRTYNAKPLNMQMNVGSVFDGRYLYFCSYSNNKRKGQSPSNRRRKRNYG